MLPAGVLKVDEERMYHHVNQACTALCTDLDQVRYTFFRPPSIPPSLPPSLLPSFPLPLFWSLLLNDDYDDDDEEEVEKEGYFEGDSSRVKVLTFPQ